MNKHHAAALWSALLPDARLKRAMSNLYRAVMPDGSAVELEITDTRVMVMLKAQGWTFERIEK